jgi:D-alanyl-D-alanine carboxypeptidase
MFVMRGASVTLATAAPNHTVAAPVVRARAAVVMDAKTAALLWAKRPDDRLPPASTTKVMTAILALESGKLDAPFVVSETASATQAVKLYLGTGDRVQLDDLTRAMLLKSANDASVVVAEGLGGSVKGFSALMNRRAFQVGARNTRFVNPNGLPAQGHYSTVRDLALIMRHALSVPGFREFAGTYRSTVTAWHQKKRRTIHLRNSNRLLQGYRVPVIGKTGYTRAAKRCFVGAASENGREIIVALLGSTDLWGDARRLVDFGLKAAAAGAPEMPPARPDPPVARQVKNAPPPARTPTRPARASETSRMVPMPPGVAARAPAALDRGAQAEATAVPPRVTPAATDARALDVVANAPRAPGISDAASEAVLREDALADDGEGYSLVLMPADNSRAAAERLRHFVGRRGHRAVVETTGSVESRLYRVRIVALPSREAALRAGDRLRAEHLNPAIVPPG